jgi:hypothetical protein
MDDEELLDEMRLQYKYATLEDHMLVDGKVFRRCGACQKRPVPPEAGAVMWCDPCLDECLAGDLEPAEFYKWKRAQSGAET